jgi:hypothetical protein
MGLCDDVVMRGVGVVAVSGVWWLFVVVGVDLVVVCGGLGVVEN